MPQIKTDTQKLKSLYSEEKLKELSASIIDAYRKRDNSFLGRYSTILGISASEFERNPTRSFRKMMLFFHPDRRYSLHKTIDLLEEKGNWDLLDKMELCLRSGNKKKKVVPGDEIFTRKEHYTYDQFFDELKADDFVYTTKDTTRVRESETYEFIEAVRAMMYGNLPGGFNPTDLYHLDGELNLSEEGVYDLSGIEHCINVTELILAKNRIDNIYDLSGLTQLIALDLSHNDITLIDELRSLDSLKYLDLSFNSIEDITPLRALSSLKYVNLIGNPVKDNHKTLSFLKRNGIIVVI